MRLNHSLDVDRRVRSDAGSSLRFGVGCRALLGVSALASRLDTRFFSLGGGDSERALLCGGAG